MWQITYSRIGQRMTIWRMRVSRWIPKATNRHSEYVILSAFFTLTMVAGRCHNITLYLHFLSSYSINLHMKRILMSDQKMIAVGKNQPKLAFKTHYSSRFLHFKFQNIIHALPCAAFSSAVFVTQVNYCFTEFRTSCSLVFKCQEQLQQQWYKLNVLHKIVTLLVG